MNKQSGFTLVEFMVTITIMVILLGVGIPSFRYFVERSRLTTTANDLVSALQLARSEAVKRGLPFTMCSSSDQTTCSGTWTSGWIVSDTVNTPQRVWPPARDGVAIVGAGGPVEFSPLGYATGTSCFDVTLNSALRSVSIGPAGRITSSETACP